MKTMIRTAAAAVALATALTGTAFAQDAAAPVEPEAFVTFSGTVGVFSDYRFRGISLSDKDIVLQGSLTATTKPGFFVSVWGSSIEQYAGAEQEIDLTLGWSGDVGGATLGGGIIGYFYPGGDNVDYYEVYGTVGGSFGPVGVTVGVNYAPEQNNLADDDNFYVYVSPSFAIPDTPLTLKGSIGYEDGFFQGGTDSKIDWMIGADFTWKVLTFGVQYIDNDLNNKAFVPRISGDAVVFSVSASF